MIRSSSPSQWPGSRPASNRNRATFQHVSDRLLFVGQVAPYRDGPAGVHGVLDQAARAVAQLAELQGLRRCTASTTSARSRRRRCVKRARSCCSRSARRPGVPNSRRDPRSRAGGRARGGRGAFRDRLVLRMERVRRAGRRPLRRPPVDAILHGRRARPSPSHVRAPRGRLGVPRRGVPVPRPPTRRARAPAGA